MALEVTPSLVIDDSELEESFVRASGPGGQNVNKVSTAVQLRYDVGRSRLDGEVRARLRTLAGSRMTDEDVLVIDARAHRTQGQNREDARARLVDLIRRALVRPKRRKKTRPGAAAKQRRLDTKKIRSETKRGRGKLRRDD
jgi:ribosome-associated protein